MCMPVGVPVFLPTATTRPASPRTLRRWLRCRRACASAPADRPGRQRSHRRRAGCRSLRRCPRRAGFRFAARPEFRRWLCGNTRCPCIEIHRRAAAAQAAVADRRILGRGDGDLGLLDRIDHRHDDAPGAAVEHPLDVVVVRLGTRASGTPPASAMAAKIAAACDQSIGAMLQVERQPVEIQPRQHAAGEQIAERKPGADGRLAGLQQIV